MEANATVVRNNTYNSTSKIIRFDTEGGTPFYKDSN